MENKIIQAIYGLNEANLDQLKDGQLTYALNAMVENFDGKQVSYQNENANKECLTIKEGFSVIGVHNIIEQNKTIFFLANETTNESEIGFKLNNGCKYNTIISSTCLNFNRNYPIPKVEVKTTNCSTQLYWTDGYNQMRYIDLDNLPWVEIRNPDNDFQPIFDIGNVDCNKLLVQPLFTIPIITPIKIEVGGSLKSGTYQFAFQYSNSLGDGLTSFYSITNPVSIFDYNRITNNFDLDSTKAIELYLSNIDTSGLYDYFNLVVLETVNLITTPKLVGTYTISDKVFRTTYTGNTKTNINLTMQDIFDRYPYYDIAKDITSSDDTLLYSNLSNSSKINYQSIWSKVRLLWETHKIPYNKFEGYINGVNTALYKGYMRDEVYAFEGCFILTNGKITESFHIPGRLINNIDNEIITNNDSKLYEQNPCDQQEQFPRWKVYNTATKIGFTDEYLLNNNNSNSSKSCYTGSYEYGEFGYYESEEKYDNNPLIWGSLSNTNIRLHKFPDLTVSPIYDNNINNDISFVHNIFPIGVKIDIQSLYDAIDQSDLTDSQKNSIQGFKIVRADRSNNKSIVAKGIFNNVGVYKYNDTNYFYNNYPFNDLNPDIFISSIKVKDHSGNNKGTRLDGFNNLYSHSRLTFHSPDTHFYQPSSIDSGYVKLESIIYGKSKGHFVEVQDNAKYKFLTSDAVRVAFALGMSSGVGLQGGFAGLSSGVQAKVDFGSIMPVFAASLELLKNITPLENYGWSFNNIGNYNNSYPIPNAGNKNRAISLGNYVINGFQSTGDIYTLNNNTRESSIYLKLNNDIPFTHDYSNNSIVIPKDNSRFSLTSENDSGTNILPIQDWFNNIPLEVRLDPRTFFDNIPEDGNFGSDIIAYQRIINTYTTYDELTSPEHIRETLIIANAILSTYDNYVDNLSRNQVELGDCVNPGRFRERNISSYYGAIKRIVNDQYGRMYSYKTIDTGFYSTLYYKDDTNINQRYSTLPTIFGGDVYINKFAFKIKHGFFLYNTALKPDLTDINLDQLGNVGYPIYYYSTTPVDLNIDFSSLNDAINQITSNDFDVIFSNIISGGTAPMIAGLKILATILLAYVKTLGKPNINLECSKIKTINEVGKAYLYAYGIPYFFVESEVNVDNRQAYNDREGDFYPHVNLDVPDDWLQEKNVAIINDNTYTYNKSFSKQNTETFFDHLRNDYDPNKICQFNFPNRVIYSQKANVEETKNNWLVYRPASKHDLPKNFGKLISIDGLEDAKLLVRYENKSQLYNVLSTINTSTGSAYIGNPNFFSSKPLDFIESEVGYNGTQNKFFLKTQYGHFTVDCQRGQIFVLRGNELKEISLNGLPKYFSNSLPFIIKDYYPTVDIDNHFKNIGLTGCIDVNNDRFILTKKDYRPLDSNIVYNDSTKEFYLNDILIKVTDNRYFCNHSFTISYSFKTDSWISWHSYIKDYYISHPFKFESGSNTTNKIHSHDDILNFNRYDGIIYDYILEYPVKSLPNEEILGSISDYTNVFKYVDQYSYTQIDNIYFNKCIIYNNQQCTGELVLVPKEYNRMSQALKYPKYNLTNKEIIVTKSNSNYNFNTFWDIVSNKNIPFFVKSCNTNSLDKTLNNSVLNYQNKSFNKSRIMGKEAKIRLIYNTSDQYKLISRFLITQTQTSYK